MSEDTSAPARPLRIGAVRYLNTKVMLWGIPESGPDHVLELHTPSVLARKLAAGELDLALVSSIEYFRHPEYVIMPGLSITGRAEMWSTALFLRTPLESARRLGLDPASETTNALLRILMKERFRSTAELVPLTSTEDPLARTDLDGFVKIGDEAMKLSWPGLRKVDLMAEWHAFTNLSFVFALWLTHRKTHLRGWDKRLLQAKFEGLRNAAEIANAYAAAAGLDPLRAREYVSRVVAYDLGPRELGGLNLFRSYLLRLRLIDRDRPFEFYH